ncbi:bifunctional nuclease family protein [candidate division WWE3 bacterium]|uniref:Bifunctional nuclease family protein n=1 Tax=candidate division WWE3 bacterium TaxID=2053526 RepID=A0A7X9E6I8_UNCKA|nr:bifunctional nuclease family protein [candidate division WWE3 bacterium]
MYKPVKFITSIPYKGFSTYYLFNKKNKILIPIEINKENNSKITPSIYNSLNRLVSALGYSFLYIKIYKLYQNTFYTYLSLSKRNEHNNINKVMDLNISFEDGISMSKEANIPIYIKESIAKEIGIEITKKLVEKALSNQ